MERRKIKKLLIANRGEIALRVAKTCKALGIKVVAVYSPADANMPFVRFADESYPLEFNESKESYLNIPKLVEICKQANVDAVHPGYGFLSENHNFAKALLNANILFVGPSPESIFLMGDKVESRKKMLEAGVPVIPGYDGGNQDPDFLLERAREIGFPIMIKASAGGGGKGIRRVENPKDFKDNLQSVKREALNFFSNDTVFIEKFITTPRHIEVQILGDSKGNITHLYERDCSVQRKNQKVIEECPSVYLSDELKESIYKASILAGSSIGYENAGTVEFVVSEHDFFFLEMNTRLQVEHPVTEMVTGIDLVEAQIKITEGEALENILPSPIPLNGHAIELRICAEEGGDNPIPGIGKILHFQFPSDKETRLDSGVEKGSVVTPYYDSMISKLIVHGENRGRAILKAIKVLEQSSILGLPSNLSYLKSLISHERFIEGGVDTGFISNYTFSNQEVNLDKIAAISHLIHSIHLNKLESELFKKFRNWGNHNSGIAISTLTKPYKSLRNPYFISKAIIQEKEEYKILNKSFFVHCIEVRDLSFLLEINDGNNISHIELPLPKITNAQVQFEQESDIYFYTKSGRNIFLSHLSKMYKAEQIDYLSKDKSKADTLFRSPMPGKIVSLKVDKGTRLEEGEPLIVIEAMKMENIIYAPAKLIVKEIYFKEGDQVDSEAELLKVSYD
ncbi:MAG: ATP-grasp domain-containing protein [Leptospiraceae bacterium]|nr:ATP-grasp domain-containing protein [Leptospiraceae bacterium]